jgi:hypothetical protein
MVNGQPVDGGWRDRPRSRVPPLATMTELAALPLEMANLSFLMATVGLTAFFRLMETLLPAMRPGPIVSK